MTINFRWYWILLSGCIFAVMFYETDKEIESCRQQQVLTEQVAVLNQQISSVSIAGASDEGLRQVWIKK